MEDLDRIKQELCDEARLMSRDECMAQNDRVSRVIEIARDTLGCNRRFFSMSVDTLGTFGVSEIIEGANVGDFVIVHNPAFTRCLDGEAILGIVAHEVAHVVRGCDYTDPVAEELEVDKLAAKYFYSQMVCAIEQTAEVCGWDLAPADHPTMREKLFQLEQIGQELMV